MRRDGDGGWDRDECSEKRLPVRQSEEVSRRIGRSVIRFGPAAPFFYFSPYLLPVMNGNTSFSPSCTRYESAAESLNGSYEETVTDGSFLQHESASGGSAGDTIASLFDPRTPHPPAKSRMSFFSMKQFDPLLKTPHSPLMESRPSTITESPADLPTDGPLIPVTPVAAAAVSATAATPARVNGTTSGLSEALEVIRWLKAANEELVVLVMAGEEKIALLTEERDKLQAKLRKILTSLSSD